MRAVIISNGSFDIEVFKRHKDPNDIVICADGGGNYLYKTDIIPDMIVGDLDSLDQDAIKYYRDKDVVFHKFPTRKDKTDTELAVEFALKQDPSEIILFGSTGSRLDHTLGNIMLLYKLLKRDIKAKVVDRNNEIYITDGYIEIPGEKDRFVSFIPLFDKCTGVTMKGFKYSTDDIDFEIGSTMGISNEVIEDKGIIDIESGIALIILSKDK